MSAGARTVLWFSAMLVAVAWFAERDLSVLGKLVNAPKTAAENSAGAASSATAPGATLPLAGAHAVDESEPPLPAPHAALPASSLPAAGQAQGPVGQAAPVESSAPLFSGSAIDDPCLRRARAECLTHAMDPFYRALLGTREKRVVRVGHFGDSIIASDVISSRLRERLQATYGDAGAGFVYLARPSSWYLRHAVRHYSTGWTARSISTRMRAPDGLYGVGGATFEGTLRTTWSSFATTIKGSNGGAASRFDLYYLEQPNGGTLEILVDGKLAKRLSTAAPTVKSAFYRIDVEDGPHSLIIRPAKGEVRAFGLVMEREGPGISFDSLGLVSSAARALTLINAPHWAEQLEHRALDLGIFLYGTNEAGYTGTSTKAAEGYEASFTRMLNAFRTARPGAACLVMSPLDSATEADGKLVTKPAIPVLVEAQRRAALSQGCGFWDTFAWMGGKGTMPAWFQKGWVSSDFTHPSRAGGAKVADALYDALEHGLAEFSTRKPPPEPPEPPASPLPPEPEAEPLAGEVAPVAGAGAGQNR